MLLSCLLKLLIFAVVIVVVDFVSPGAAMFPVVVGDTAAVRFDQICSYKFRFKSTQV